MSSRTSRLLSAGLFGAAVALFILGLAKGQDPLKDAAARQQLELQRVQAEVRDANDAADKAKARGDFKQAVERLQATRAKVAGNDALPDKERAALLLQLDTRIDALTKRLSSSVPIPTPPLPRPDDKRGADEGKQQVDKAKKFRESAEFALRNKEYLEEQRKQGFLAIQVEVEKIAIAPSGDIEFPRNWRELTMKRQQINVTEKEKKILKALDTPIDIDLKDSTLQAVLGYLNDKTGLNLDVPKLILEERSITYQTPVSVSLKNVRVKTVLKKVLSDVGLTYTIAKESVVITTEERAKEMLSTRTYYIGDLIGHTGQRLGGLNNLTATMLAVNDIIGVLIGTVEPQSWWVNGGPGTIAFDPKSMSLVVKQTAEVHYRLVIGGR
jgi:predicted RNA-binding protein Jag